ncbi:Ig-like domain-containing protein [Pseudomonas sp. NPDC086251]|uniref:Ig-like domain-containing protein n=1 Tax=Pseudomonas sp. NPDC086251 TaxID=3364431 RepID=UPI003835283F
MALASAYYALQVNETLDAQAPTAPTMSVSDRNANNQPEASGTTEAGNTVLVTWPDNSSSVVADGSGQWTVEASTVQPSGHVVAVSQDA